MIPRIVSCLFLSALFVNSALGSKERILEWRTFQIESLGTSESGAVTVTGSQSSKGIDSIRVDAFGKSFTLKEEDLAKLRGVMANSVQLSFEAGYHELGGRTIYLLIATGFTSGTTKGKMISITERGDIRIEDFGGPP
jgi:hypothetical protein